MLDDYYDRHFIDDKGNIIIQTCTDINTEVLIKKLPQLIINDTYQIIDNTVFITTGKYNLKAYHHGTSSWTDYPKTKLCKRKEYKDTRIKSMLRNYKIQYFIRNNLGSKVLSVYTFIVYDLLENGLAFYISRWMKKYLFIKKL